MQPSDHSQESNESGAFVMGDGVQDNTIGNCELDDEQTANGVGVHPIITVMANMMNYLTLSLYQGQFTYNHERSWARLNTLYDQLSKTSSVAPSLKVSGEFYENVVYLRRVTETDDPDYASYMGKIRHYVCTLPKTQIFVIAESTPAYESDDIDWLQR